MPSAALLFAFLTPLLWAVMNVLDKYVVTYKVRTPEAFSFVIACVNLLFGALLALTLDWSRAPMGAFLAPLAVGILFAIDAYLYYLILDTEDTSHFIGVLYVYPVLIALFSFAFLGERLSPLGYAGMGLAVAGAVLLSVRIRKARLEASAWLLVLTVLVVAGYELLAKVATQRLPAAQALCVTTLAFWLAMLPLLLRRRVRAAVASESRNLGWALVTEALTFSALLCTYLAMAGLPASVASSIFTLQPLFVVLLERVAQARVGGMTKDERLLPKLGAIALIVAGVALLYVAELL